MTQVVEGTPHVELLLMVRGQVVRTRELAHVVAAEDTSRAL
jgi:hypothetical protein